MGEGVVGAREFSLPRFLQWPKKFLAYTGGDLVGLVSRGHCPRGSWHHTSSKPIFRNKQETRIEATKAGSRNKHVTDFNS